MDKITLIIILLLLWVSFLITNIFNTIDPVIIDSGNPGPVVLMVGGTHGNEPAGTVGLEKLIKSNLYIKRGKIIIVPKVNKIGLSLGIRFGFNGFLPIDYNRFYPLEYNQINKDILIKNGLYNKNTIVDTINKIIILKEQIKEKIDTTKWNHIF